MDLMADTVKRAARSASLSGPNQKHHPLSTPTTHRDRPITAIKLLFKLRCNGEWWVRGCGVLPTCCYTMWYVEESRKAVVGCLVDISSPSLPTPQLQRRPSIIAPRRMPHPRPPRRAVDLARSGPAWRRLFAAVRSPRLRPLAGRCAGWLWPSPPWVAWPSLSGPARSSRLRRSAPTPVQGARRLPSAPRRALPCAVRGLRGVVASRVGLSKRLL